MGKHFVRRAATSGAMLIAGTTAGLALYGPATAAFAYGNPVCSVSVTPSPVQDGGTITVTVTGPGGTYTVTLNHNTVKTALTPAITVPQPSGTASQSYGIARNQNSGQYVVTASSGAAGCTASARLTVTPAQATLGGATGTPGTPGSSSSAHSGLAFTTAPPAHSGLAFTGADIALTVAGGAAAVGVGGSLVLLSRRRRQLA